MFEFLFCLGVFVIIYGLLDDRDVIKDKQEARALYSLGREGYIKRVEIPYPIVKKY
jgi:hypothetical protein